MAEADAKADKKTEGEAGGPRKKPVKLIGIVAAVMVLEAVGVYVLVSAMGPKPQVAEAKHIEGDHASGEELVELALVDDRFQNLSSGTTWLWDCALFIQVKKKNEEYAKGRLKAKEAEIKEGVSMIFRKATLNQLKEPGLETINRQVTAFVNTVIEPDKEKVARVERVLIPKARGFALD